MRLSRPGPSVNGDQGGQILTELALAAPVLLAALVAVVGLAQAGQKKALVTRAAGAAARVAVVRPDLAGAEALRVLRDSDGEIDARDVETRVKPVRLTGMPFMRPVKVSVSLRYRPPAGFGWRPVLYLRSEFVADRWANGVWFDIPPPVRR